MGCWCGGAQWRITAIPNHRRCGWGSGSSVPRVSQVSICHKSPFYRTSILMNPSRDSLDLSDVEDITSESKGLAFQTRSVLIISPEKKLKMAFHYPASVGMYIAELIRVVDCLQVVSNRGLVACLPFYPCVQCIDFLYADYCKGSAHRLIGCLVPMSWLPPRWQMRKQRQVWSIPLFSLVVRSLSIDVFFNQELFPGFRPVKPYLRFVEYPVKRLKTGHIIYNKGSLQAFGAEGESLREMTSGEAPMERGSATALT